MPIDERMRDRMRDTAPGRTPAAAAHRASRCACGAPGRAGDSPRRRGAHAFVGRVHAVVALLLLLLMPLGLLHRSATGACRYDHRAAVTGSTVAAADAGLDALHSASAEHQRIISGDQHDHRGGGLPLHGAAPGACGPAVVADRPEPGSGTRSQADLPAWRARSPLALATPPPAPPPRLS